MSSWREFLKKKRQDPNLAGKSEPEKMKLAGIEWRKMTGKPKAPKKTRKHKKEKHEKHEKHGKPGKHTKTQTVHMKCGKCDCKLTIELSCD
jgi:hypothetical protein